MDPQNILLGLAAANVLVNVGIFYRLGNHSARIVELERKEQAA